MTGKDRRLCERCNHSIFAHQLKQEKGHQYCREAFCTCPNVKEPK